MAFIIRWKCTEGSREWFKIHVLYSALTGVMSKAVSWGRINEWLQPALLNTIWITGLFVVGVCHCADTHHKGTLIILFSTSYLPQKCQRILGNLYDVTKLLHLTLQRWGYINKNMTYHPVFLVLSYFVGWLDCRKTIFPGLEEAPSSSSQNLHNFLGLSGDGRAGSTFMPFKVVIRGSLPKNGKQA